MPTFVNGPNYLALPRNTQKWLIKDLLPAGGLANLYGKPKTKKSFVALHMAAAVSNPAIGKWETHDVLTHGPVMYLQIDTPRTAWGDRVNNVTNLGKDFANVWFCDMQMVPAYPFNCLDPASLKWLAEEILLIKPVLVIVDTLREAHSSDENDSTAMRNVIGQLVSCVLPVQAAILFLSHQKKDSAYMKAGGDDLMDDARGSSYVPGRMDNIMRLTETRLVWKGRMGSGDMAVNWDDELLAVVADPSEAARRVVVVRVMKEEVGKNPKVKAAEVARVLETELSLSHRTCLREIEDAGGLKSVK